MSWRQFIADVIGSLAWPALLLALALVFRAELGALIGRLRSASFRGVQLEFSDGVQRAAALADAVQIPAPQPAGAGLAPPPPVASPQPLIQADPTLAVVEGWSLVEADLMLLANRHGVQAATVPELLDALTVANVLPSSTRSVMDELRGLRNTAVHARDYVVAPEAASQYIDVAERVASQLRSF